MPCHQGFLRDGSEPYAVVVGPAVHVSSPRSNDERADRARAYRERHRAKLLLHAADVTLSAIGVATS